MPVLDGVACAVRPAEALVGLAPRAPSRDPFARPPAKSSRGLSEALAARIERRDEAGCPDSRLKISRGYNGRIPEQTCESRRPIGRSLAFVYDQLAANG